MDCFVETAVGFVGEALGFAGTDLELAGIAAAEAERFGAAGTVVRFVGTGGNSAVETDLVALPGTEELGIAPVVVVAEIDELWLPVADCSELSGPENNDIPYILYDFLT